MVRFVFLFLFFVFSHHQFYDSLDCAMVRPISGNSFKETALHVAVLANAPVKFVSFLVEKCGGEQLVSARNNSGETALHYASRAQNAVLYGMLIENHGALERRNSIADWAPTRPTSGASPTSPEPETRRGGRKQKGQ